MKSNVRRPRFSKQTVVRAARQKEVNTVAMTNEEFSRLVEEHERLVFGICYQMVRDYHEAQNLAQEAFLAAYRHIDGCPDGHVKPWLARIATNKAKDYLKSAYARRVSLCEEEQLERLPAPHAPEETVISLDTVRMVRGQIEALKEPYAKVSRLFFLEEKSVEEISGLLGRPPKTVQTQLYRAKAMLQGLLREEESG